MELSAKVLREVEFRDRLRGYDTDEVDEFLEKVALAVDELQEKMRQLTYRAERAERTASDRAIDEDEDSIRRTLVLAQRTADLAVREAQEQAASLMDSARLSSEAERRHRDELARLENQRDQVRGELAALSGLLDAERTRLAEALGAALRFVERTLTPGKELSELRPTPPSSPGRVPDDLEAQINEDAAAAAPLAPATPAPDSGAGPEDKEAASPEGEGGRANLAAVPSLDESGPETETWHLPQMTADTAGRRFGGAASSDWTA
jgi:cell division initiation protein